MHDINFEHYKVFYYVAKNLSFSKASKELFISQSAVSQSIKNLENRLGVALFLRHSKKISLTNEGEYLYDNVKTAFSYIKNSELSINQNDSNIKKEVKIAASDTISKYFLIPHIDRFHKENPDVKIKIMNKPSFECIDLLKNIDVDISFINLTTSIDDNGLEVTKIKKIQDIFVAGPKYSYLKDKSVKLSEIEKLPVLALEKSSSIRKNLDELCTLHNVDIKLEIEMQSMGLLKDLARIGLGISYISDLAITKTTDLFTLNIKEELPFSHVALILLKKQKPNIYCSKFIDIVKNN